MSTYGTILNVNLCERNLLDVCFTPVLMHCSPLLTFPFSKTINKNPINFMHLFTYLSVFDAMAHLYSNTDVLQGSTLGSLLTLCSLWVISSTAATS